MAQVAEPRPSGSGAGRTYSHRALVPFFVVAAGLFACRLALLGGIGGYRDAGTGQAQALNLSAISTLKALMFRLWSVLLFPVNWSFHPGAIFAIALIGYMASLFWLATHGADKRRLIFALGLILVCSLPPLHLLLIGADMLKSRLLYLPSAGFCLLLALAVERLHGFRRWIIPGVVLGFNLIALEHNLNVWKYVSDKSEETLDFAAKCVGPTTQKMIVRGLPASLFGIYFFGNGFPEGVELRHVRRSVPIELRRKLEPPDAVEGECLLEWDPSRHELKPIMH